MALFKPILGQISGSIGGDTFAHNAGGQYVRQKVIPTNPATPSQTAFRALFAQITARWKTLIQAQRDGWATYAANTPVTNRLGDTVYNTALNWYVAANVIRAGGGLAFMDFPPSVAGLATLTTPTFAISAATQIATITFDNSDPWADTDDGILQIQQGRPQTTSINYFRGPWQPTQYIEGDTAIPPTSPDATGSLVFGVIEGQKVFMRFRAVDATGRVSAPVIGTAVVAA